MLLDASTRKIQVFLAGAITTNNLPVTGEYVDSTATALPTGAAFFTNTNGVTVVDCVTGAASTRRKITRFNVFNQDTAAATVTVRFNDNGTVYWIGKWTLAVGDQLCYTDTAGWFVLDGSGNLKTASSGAPNNSYRVILDSSGSHIAGKTAAVYGLGQGHPLLVTGGTGSLEPLNLIHIAAADFPTIGGLGTKMKIKGSINVNETAPTGTYTLGLYPVTRPGASAGGAGLLVYTIGTVVTGSASNTVSAPGARSQTLMESADFAIPADGYYCIGMVQTGTVAASSHLHFSAALMMRNN